MQVQQTSFTVAEFCQQLKDGKIIVNRDYQRSSKVWPPAARSYLIDTIIHGYPMPKLSMRQKTDLRSRMTVKEIVDGQQRSAAIADFYQDKLRISGKSEIKGSRFSDLEEPDQQRFVDYSLSVDLFVGATEEEIREVFRRINSYTLPLNYQERRHATFQGEFKWFIVDCSEKYADFLKRIGAFSESQLSRMMDARFLTEVVYAMLRGIDHASESKLDALYKEFDQAFPQERDIAARLKKAFDRIAGWEDIHRGPLMRSYSLYSLLLATSHTLSPLPPLSPLCGVKGERSIDDELAITNLTHLASALEIPEQGIADDFVEACAKATNRRVPREARFCWFCKALGPQLLR